jgi:hydrogenase nickel incorporation protein HypA/HybF
MHEYSLIQALLSQVDAQVKAHGAVSVRRVRLRIGEQSGVDAELLATAYETFTPGTLCGTAALQIVPVAAAWACAGCGRPIAQGDRLQCGSCGAPAKLVAGNELLLDQLELEVP